MAIKSDLDKSENEKRSHQPQPPSPSQSSQDCRRLAQLPQGLPPDCALKRGNRLGEHSPKYNCPSVTLGCNGGVLSLSLFFFFSLIILLHFTGSFHAV